MKEIVKMFGKQSNTIIEVLGIINNNGYGTAFILDNNNMFIGLVTDGDIRKAILRGISLNENIQSILNFRPIIVKQGISKNKVLDLMINKKIIYTIPVLNDKKEVIDFFHLSDFLKDEFKNNNSLNIKNLEGKKYVLLIGGAGYIGSCLCRYFLKKKYKVRVFDNLLFGIEAIKDLLDNSNFDFIEGDYTNINLLMKSLENVSAVIHLAAIVGDPAGKVDPSLTVEVNQYGVKILTELCKIKNVKRLIYLSTCSVYGCHETGSLSEVSKLNPISLYAKTKVKAENNVLSLKSENFFPTVIRLATVFGLSYRMRFDLVINLLAAKAINEKKITIFSGEQWRPFIHVKDVARAIYKILLAEEEKISGEIFNIGGNNLNLKIKDLIPIYLKTFPKLEIIETIDKEDNRSYRVSFEKAKNVLNFEPKCTLEDCLREIQDFFKRNPNLNYKEDKFSNVKNFKYGILNALTFNE